MMEELKYFHISKSNRQQMVSLSPKKSMPRTLSKSLAWMDWKWKTTPMSPMTEVTKNEFGAFVDEKRYRDMIIHLYILHHHVLISYLLRVYVLDCKVTQRKQPWKSWNRFFESLLVLKNSDYHFWVVKLLSWLFWIVIIWIVTDWKSTSGTMHLSGYFEVYDQIVNKIV